MWPVAPIEPHALLQIECVVTPGHELPTLTDDEWRYILSRKCVRLLAARQHGQERVLE